MTPEAGRDRFKLKFFEISADSISELQALMPESGSRQIEKKYGAKQPDGSYPKHITASLRKNTDGSLYINYLTQLSNPGGPYRSSSEQYQINIKFEGEKVLASVLEIKSSEKDGRSVPKTKVLNTAQDVQSALSAVVLILQDADKKAAT